MASLAAASAISNLDFSPSPARRTRRALKRCSSPTLLSSASRLQDSTGTKAWISASRSQTSRSATDWTRPALVPFWTLSQRKGLSR